MQKKPKTGLLILLVAVGAGAAGFLAGLQVAADRPAGRGEMAKASVRPSREREDWESAWDEFDPPGGAVDAVELDEHPPRAIGGASAGEGIKPSELLDALRRHAGSPRGQKMLLGMVADAAQAGSGMLPEIKRLLTEGSDIQFKAYDPKQPGYPSLRVALLAAAEATGDPEAARLIAEVAQTSENPVEVIFSAHMLGRLDALDAQTAQRTLDSLAKPLTKEQIKAMASVVRQVIPAAAAADPAYAELFLTTQMRAPQGRGANPRIFAPVLDGLPMERARDIVLSTVNAPDINERVKSMLAGRAAQRTELKMLQDLRSAIESNTLSQRVTRSIASSSMGGAGYGRLRNGAFRAIRSGDLAKAQQLAKSYEARLAEAARTVQAARATGARLPRDINARATLLRQRLNQVLDRIRAGYRKREKQAAQSKSKNKN